MSTDQSEKDSECYVQRAQTKIQRHLSRSLDIIRIEVIDDPEMQPRGASPSDTDAIFLVRIKHPENDDVFGDLRRGAAEGALHSHVEEQLFDVDAFIIESNIPPRRAMNQSCFFYIQAAL